MIKPIAVSSLPPAPRFSTLDALRGFAAVAVVAYHIFVILWSGLPHDGDLLTGIAVRAFIVVARWGFLGVPVFFVLSGFCVGQTWLRSTSSRDFALRRLRRIFPGYFASLALVLACAVAAKVITGTNDIAAFPAPTFGNVLATATAFTKPASSVPTVNWVYWSLSYEIVFYALLTAVLLLASRLRIGALVIVCLAGCVLTFLPQWSPRPGPLFFCDLWPIFTLGLALAVWDVHRPAATAIGVGAAAGLVAVAKNPLYPGTVAAALATAIAIAFIPRHRAFRYLRPLETVGDFSYSLYLTHVPLLLLFGRRLILPMHTQATVLVGCAVVMLISLAVAWVFCRYFEKPFHRGTRATGRLKTT